MSDLGISEAELEDLTKPMIDEPCMGNDRFGVLVYQYLFGQLRIQVTDREQPEHGAPEGHSAIVRLLDTYDPIKLVATVRSIVRADDPLEYCDSLARPWNTDFPGDRVRLDNKPSDRPERIEIVTPIDAPIDAPVYVRCAGDGEFDMPRPAIKRLEAAPDGDGYVFFFYALDEPTESDDPLFNEETGKSSVVECYVMRESNHA